MNAPLHLSYTNEVTADFLRTIDNSPYTEQQLADFSEDALEMVRQREDYAKAHPPIAIYRLATEGSQTRNGGVIQQATTLMEIKLDNGQKVHVAQKGDCAVYTDGSTAQIVTGAGAANSDIALVGSYLSNGDEIINTPQASCLMIVREGVPMADDFLRTIGE